MLETLPCCWKRTRHDACWEFKIDLSGAHLRHRLHLFCKFSNTSISLMFSSEDEGAPGLCSAYFACTCCGDVKPRTLGVFLYKSRGLLVSSCSVQTFFAESWTKSSYYLPPPTPHHHGCGPAEGFFLLLIQGSVRLWVSVKRPEATLIVTIAIWMKLNTSCAVVWRIQTQKVANGSQRACFCSHPLTIDKIIREPVNNVTLFLFI